MTLIPDEAGVSPQYAERYGKSASKQLSPRRETHIPQYAESYGKSASKQLSPRRENNVVEKSTYISGGNIYQQRK